MSKSLMDKINAGREYRSMKFECRAQAEGAEPSYIVEGYASTFDESYSMGSGNGWEFYERVSPKAFEKTDMSDVIMQFDHEGRVYARISNGTLTVTTDEHGLKVSANLGGTEEGRKLCEEIRGGYINKMSFGFTVRGESFSEERKENGVTVYTRTIDDVAKLYDVSAVSLPANDGTEISARKLRDGLTARLEAERLNEERQKDIAKELEVKEARLKVLKLL